SPLYCNAEAMRLLGQGIDPDVALDGLARHYRARIAGTDIPYPVEEFGGEVFGGRTLTVDDIEVLGPNGLARLEVRAAPILEDDGRVAFAIVTFRDITEQQAALDDVE